MDAKRQKREIIGDDAGGGVSDAKSSNITAADGAAEQSFSGVYLAVSTFNTVQLRDGLSGRLLTTFHASPLHDPYHVHSFCVDPSNTVLVTCRMINKPVQPPSGGYAYESVDIYELWDLQSYGELRTIECNVPKRERREAEQNIAFNSTGSQFVTSWQRVFDTNTGDQVAALSTEETRIFSFCYNSDDCALFIGSQAVSIGITLKDVRTGEILKTLEGSEGHRSILPNRAGSTVLSHGHIKVCCWDYLTGDKVSGFEVDDVRSQKDLH
jgi:hypothetical protein